MYIKTTYVGTLDGTPGIWCGFCPEGAVITEERQVLYPEQNYSLRRIATLEVFSAVWLQDGDVQENYEEIPEEHDTEYKGLHLTRGDVFRGLLQRPRKLPRQIPYGLLRPAKQLRLQHYIQLQHQK